MLDASWALGHHPKVVDFGFRALKETTDKAKAVIAAFYGSAATRSYFVGCSDGGREALMEAQRFPDDFDGIVAAAPANFWSHHFTGFIWNQQALLGEGAIPPAKLTAHPVRRFGEVRRDRRGEGGGDHRPASVQFRSGVAAVRRR